MAQVRAAFHSREGSALPILVRYGYETGCPVRRGVPGDRYCGPVSGIPDPESTPANARSIEDAIAR